MQFLGRLVYNQRQLPDHQWGLHHHRRGVHIECAMRTCWHMLKFRCKLSIQCAMSNNRRQVQHPNGDGVL